MTCVGADRAIGRRWLASDFAARRVPADSSGGADAERVAPGKSRGTIVTTTTDSLRNVKDRFTEFGGPDCHPIRCFAITIRWIWLVPS